MGDTGESSEKTETFIPRNYQVELMRISLARNTIIYLPTGSGKTFIAILVLKQLSSALKLPYSMGGKLSIITVKSVALVGQHGKYVQDHTNLKVGCYTGDLNVDFWSKDLWLGEFNKHQVIILTAQILLDLVYKSFIDLNQVNLLIFDECHRGVDEDAMRQIMRNFQNLVDPPRVIGLTATLLNGNCKLKDVANKVKELETTYQAQVATVEGLEEVVGYSTNPKEIYKIFHGYHSMSADHFAIQQLGILLDLLSKFKLSSPGEERRDIGLANLGPSPLSETLRKLKNLIKDLVEQIKVMGTYGGCIATVAHMIQVERLQRHCEHLTLRYVLNHVQSIFCCIRQVFKKAMGESSEVDKLYRFSSDKIIKLLEVFEEYPKISKEELCAIVFTKRRFTAKVLHHVIRGAADKFPHIKSNFIVGNNNNPFNDTRENLFIAKKNKEVLNSFTSKEINVLFSSNLLEEGIDIPKCTLVLKFDKCEEYRSYIQSKGRARHKESIYYTLVEAAEKQKFFDRLKEFQAIERELNTDLIGQSLSRSAPSQFEIENMYNEDLIRPYFVNGPNSAQINMLNSISLLCQYCQSLPSDEYTTYAPDWYLDYQTNSSGVKEVRVVIFMPVICPIVETIEGPFMKTKKDAKRAAAMVACVKLHQIGELTNKLLPRKKEVDVEDVSFLFPHLSEEKESRAGYKKMKRLHNLVVPQCLSSPIVPLRSLYLHVINLELAYDRDSEFTSTCLYDMYTDNLSYGLISACPIPKLCQFPLYNSQGTINVVIKENMKVVQLTEEELMVLKKFHLMVFQDILEALKCFLMFKNCDGTDHLLVVPIRKDVCEVDLEIARSFPQLKPKIATMPVDERLNVNVTEETYLHKIVSPWYRAQAQMYIVTQIVFDKTPLTAFPNNDYDSFSHYYVDKHNVTILNETQPLLRVKAISSKLNFFKPKSAISDAKRKREMRFEEMEEFLVPELLVKQELPGCLWVQGRLLASIISRGIYLIKLAELQETIAIEGDFILSNDYTPLKLDMHLLNFVPAQEAEEVEEDFQKQSASVVLTTNFLTQISNKDFTSKMLEAEYPWKIIDEPKDIERDLNVTVVDIEYYENFISQGITDQEILIGKSPQKVPSITYPREYTPIELTLIKKKSIVSPNLSQIYEAMTTAEAADIVNLERLETLGDSFLKIIASLYIMFRFPTYHEGNATSLKGKLVSNKNLYYLAKQKNLGGIAKNCDLSAKEQWVPPCFSIPDLFLTRILKREISVNSLFYFTTLSYDEKISGVLTKENEKLILDEVYPVPDDEHNSYTNMCGFINSNYLGDKSLADVVEALLGAHFLTAGFDGGVKFVEWIGIIPKSEKLAQLIAKPPPNPIINRTSTMESIDCHLPQWEEFEKIFGYHFNNRAFLLQALTHSSYSPNRTTLSYEKLEFIGDAILDFLITCYIYEHCGRLSPGQVTDLRSALVNNNTFASLVVRGGYHKFLLMINSKLQGYIDKFANYLKSKDYVIDDEVLILLEENELNIAEYIDVPKVLGDVFEALAGAVYLDSGKNLETVWTVFHKIMWKEIDLFSKNVPINVIRRLHEFPNSFPRFSKTTESVAKNKTMLSLEFMSDGVRKIVHGFGSNRTMAKRAAAKIALRSLKV